MKTNFLLQLIAVFLFLFFCQSAFAAPEFVSPQPGEGFSQMAERYGVSLKQLIKVNRDKLVNPNNVNLIHTWQKFQLPETARTELSKSSNDSTLLIYKKDMPLIMNQKHVSSDAFVPMPMRSVKNVKSAFSFLKTNGFISSLALTCMIIAIIRFRKTHSGSETEKSLNKSLRLVKSETEKTSLHNHPLCFIGFDINDKRYFITTENNEGTIKEDKLKSLIKFIRFSEERGLGKNICYNLSLSEKSGNQRELTVKERRVFEKWLEDSSQESEQLRACC